MEQHRYLQDIRFLIIDDNAFMRSILRRILEPFGANKIREAPDGAEAIKVMENWPVDIVLTDMVMAPLDGIEFTKIVRHSAHLAHQFVPIIFVSGYSEIWRIAQARDAGGTEYIVKPISAKTVMSHLRKVIEHPRPYVSAPNYFGPDRRHHQLECLKERRRTPPTFLMPDEFGAAPLRPPHPTWGGQPHRPPNRNIVLSDYRGAHVPLPQPHQHHAHV